MSFVSSNPDYTSVPAHLKDRVCGCSGVRRFTNPAQVPGIDLAATPVGFSWWVCGECLKPAPLNALNARLIRECEFCEDAYFVLTPDDRMDICPSCA